MFKKFKFGMEKAWVKLNNPYKDVDATSVEAFGDGAADQVSGNVCFLKDNIQTFLIQLTTMINNPVYSPSV